MKIYIAGPMRGIPNFNFPAFYAAEDRLRSEGHDVFNPARRDNDHYGADISAGNKTGCLEQAAKEHGFDLRKTLAADLKYICEDADSVALLPGWEKSKGANAERAVAIALGLEVIHL